MRDNASRPVEQFREATSNAGYLIERMRRFEGGGQKGIVATEELRNLAKALKVTLKPLTTSSYASDLIDSVAEIFEYIARRIDAIKAGSGADIRDIAIFGDAVAYHIGKIEELFEDLPE